MKRGGPILVVEDNLKDQAMIKTAFENIGVEDTVYTVNDGSDAIAFFKREREYADCNKFPFPTFLMTNLDLPRVNGLELLLFLKRSHLTIIPAIIFTSSAEQDDINNAYLLGANAYHVKSPGLGGLCAQLRDIYQFWISVELPKADEYGRLLPTEGKGGLGQKIGHPMITREKG
ncbi:MAG TPA: response regulator [Verrucomicrobiae bacterium]|jgi:CheY-like chemotaxis protein